MLPSSIAIFVSNDEMPSNGDAIYPFKQNSDLYWLTGIVQEDSMLILFPDHPDPKYREVLVLVRPNELKEKWDGKRLTGGRREIHFRNQHASSGWTLQMLFYKPGFIWQKIFTSDSNENDRKSSSIANTGIPVY